MADKREREVGLVTDGDGTAQGRATRLDTMQVAREDRRDGFACFDPIAHPRGDDESDGGLDDIVDLRATSAERGETTSDRPRLDTRDESAARRGEQLAGIGLGKHR